MRNNKGIILAISVLHFFYPIPANCQISYKVSDNIISKLTSFSEKHVIEKVYLHFDKPYYAAGDTIYFKAYVTMGERHKLSNLSGVLYADLINTDNKIDQSIKLQVTDGVTWGDFALPDSLPKGNYRVRAYTKLIQNNAETIFFDQTIQVGSILNSKISESKPLLTPHPDIKPDIQFFPEGGSLVTGVRSKVAIKAIGINGLGINVKGELIDSGNKQVCLFESAHLGMGCFYLVPKLGEIYKAKLTYANGLQDIVELPNPEASGIVLTVNNDSIPKAAVRIEANTAFYRQNRNRNYTLLIYSGGVATTVTCKLDSTVITLDILKRRLHTGIATVTLFSPENEPLCERLLFVQNYDQLNLAVTADKTVYGKREKVSLRLNAKNRADSAAAGHFSVSVTDESKVPEDENNAGNILTNLLLTSDLKGFVEQPNYYFNDTSAVAAKNLDVLTLTHGYRRFTWKQVLDTSGKSIAYQPEKGLEIGGVLKNLFGKPINKGTVTLLPSAGGPMLTSVSDAKGIFRFNNLVFMDSTRFVLSAVNAKGKNTTKITYFIEKPAPVIAANKQKNADTIAGTAMAVYLDNEKLQRDAFKKYGTAKGILLKQVNIKAKKEEGQRSQTYGAEFAADQVIHAKDIVYGGPLSIRLMGLLHGVYLMPQGNSYIPVLGTGLPGGRMLVLIDGLKGNIDDIGTEDVETIEVLKPPNSFVYGKEGINGVLSITTKPRMTRSEDIASIGVLPIAPIGFYKARQFYSPKYEHPNDDLKRPDMRSTIYWQPELVTDKNGDARFDYYNADGVGTYKVVIEGIDKDGNIGRQVYRYKVE